MKCHCSSCRILLHLAAAIEARTKLTGRENPEPEFATAFGVIAIASILIARDFGAVRLRARVMPHGRQIGVFMNLINRAADEERVLFNFTGWSAIGAAAFFLSTGAASAHDRMDGKTPATLVEGLLSGIGHPIIGPDYLAFLLALGIAVGVFRLSFVNPFLFVAAMIGGVAIHVAGLYLPAAGLIVPVSVLIAGLMLIIEERIPSAWWMAVFVAAGVFHGYAYGDSIYAAEPVPLVAYVIGLAAVQMIMTVGVAFATRGLWKLWSMAPRLAGAAFCGVGFGALITQLIHSD